MRKTFMGVQLRRLREERGMTQVALARALGLSASYLNQIEQNQRPMTVPVLLKINAELGVDVQRFSDDEEARLIAGLCDVLAEQPASAAPPGANGAAGEATQVSMAEIRELAASMPAVARTLMGLHTRHRQALERLEALSMRLGDDRGDRGERGHEGAAALPPMAYEEVRDFFFAQHNHIAELDDAAERCALEWALVPGRALELSAQVVRTGRTSMSVQVLGQMAPRNRSEVASEVLRGLFEMVSVDASGRPVLLAPLE